MPWIAIAIAEYEKEIDREISGGLRSIFADCQDEDSARDALNSFDDKKADSWLQVLEWFRDFEKKRADPADSQGQRMSSQPVPRLFRAFGKGWNMIYLRDAATHTVRAILFYRDGDRERQIRLAKAFPFRIFSPTV